MGEEKEKHNTFLKIVQMICRIMIGIFMVLVVLFLGIEIYSQILFKPIKVGSADTVEKITIDLINNIDGTSFEIEITEAEDLKSLIDTLEDLKAKKIINGGGGDADTDMRIEVIYDSDHSSKKWGYCVVHGNQILLSEGGTLAYQMSEEDAAEFWKYIENQLKETEGAEGELSEVEIMRHWQEFIYGSDDETPDIHLLSDRKPLLSKEVMENIDWDEDLLPYLEYDWPNDDNLRCGAYNAYTEFTLADLDEDGQRELLLSACDWTRLGITHIYTVIDGKVVYCGKTPAFSIRYGVNESVKDNPYFPKEIFDVYKDPDGRYQLISYGMRYHCGSLGYSFFETTYDMGQISFVPVYGMIMSPHRRYWTEENGEDWKEAVKGSNPLNPYGISSWEVVKWDKAIEGDENFTDLTGILSERYADYEKVNVTFQPSPYFVTARVWAYYEEDKEAVRYNIRAGLAIAAGLVKAESEEEVDSGRKELEGLWKVREIVYNDYRDAVISRTEPLLSEEVMETIDWDEDLLPYVEYDWLKEEGLWIGTLFLSYAKFTLADLNEDGQRELMITLSDHREPGITYIYTAVDGKVVFCGETLASLARYDVYENVMANPYFPEDLFDVYKDPDGQYRLISHGFADLHGGYGSYSLFESVYQNGQVTFVPAFGMLYEGGDGDYTYQYWIEEDGKDWKETVGGPYTFHADGLYEWMGIKYDEKAMDDEKYTALTQILSEKYADYEKIDVTFRHSPYIVSGDVCVYFDADQEAVRYNIRAGLAIAAGLVK